MENKQWSADYQQSVTSLERTSNKSNTKILVSESELQNPHIKEDPDAKTIFPHIKNEYKPTSVVISEKSKQTIQLILGQIKSLSQNDKYLLYLKLPSEITDIIDPFRQPLNPLGSRSEISRTIVWIQTHLEEDQNISLPKKEVYNEYEQHCDRNTIKPLSQADFGKVMKQVFPKVRARRLGQRGNSKYCYSGLRRRLNLKAPLLPDLADKPLSTEAPVTQSSLTYAAWLIVKEWAQQQLGVQFSSLQSLAHYLVRNCSIGSGSDAASKLTSNTSESQSKSEETANKTINKHREMQLQLQKKIRQRNEGKERKRKNQPAKSDPKPGAKKCRSHSVPASSTTSALSQDSGVINVSGGLTSGECSTASSSCGSNSNSVSPTQGRTICDKPEFTQLTALPDFKSFQKPVMTDGGSTNIGGGQDPVAVSVVSNTKIAIPRLLHQTSPKGSVPGQAKPQQRKAKYKAIQPRLQQCDIATYNAPVQPATTQNMAAALAETRSQQVQCVKENNINDKSTDNKCADLNECEDDEDFPLTRERLDSVSNVEKDAMDEYLGTNNSQHEEELSKYFNAGGEPDIAVDIDNSNKLSTLRQLLEQNGISEKKPSLPIIPPIGPNIALSENLTSFQSSVSNISQISAQNVPYAHPLHTLATLPTLSGNTRRRVSFETPSTEDSVPPSPNTRSKNFNFTPISPGPHSPNSTQSKCSSTNASPFVSPRSTPIPRTKNTTHQNAGIMLSQDNHRKHVKVKKELDLSLEIQNDVHLTNILPMSAPASPMIGNSSKSMLQKLLNANSKVQYTPEYATSQNVSQQTADGHFFPDLSSRSQSVPLNQMHATGITPIVTNSENIISEMLKRDQEFSNIPEQDSDNVKRLINSLDNQPCDNNNIDAFNLDMSSSNQCLTEFGLNLINTCSETNFPPFNNQPPKLRNIVRSQSIDVDAGFDSIKCNPRSVPSTPLPFTQNLKINLIDNKNFQTSSRSYPNTPLNANETFVYQVNSDCLLNGQPIRPEATVENIEFMPSFEIDSETNISQEKGFQLDGDFGIIENGDALMDENGILMRQGYNGNIN